MKQAADGVLVVVEKSLDDEESVMLFLEDAGNIASVCCHWAMAADCMLAGRCIRENVDSNRFFGIFCPHAQ